MEACSRICQGTTSDKTTKLNVSFFFAVSATMGISLQWWGSHLYKRETRHTKQHEGSDGNGIFGLDPQRRMSLLQECYLSHLGTTWYNRVRSLDASTLLENIEVCLKFGYIPNNGYQKRKR